MLLSLELKFGIQFGYKINELGLYIHIFIYFF